MLAAEQDRVAGIGDTLRARYRAMLGLVITAVVLSGCDAGVPSSCPQVPDASLLGEAECTIGIQEVLAKEVSPEFLVLHARVGLMLGANAEEALRRVREAHQSSREELLAALLLRRELVLPVRASINPASNGTAGASPEYHGAYVPSPRGMHASTNPTVEVRRDIEVIDAYIASIPASLLANVAMVVSHQTQEKR